MAVSDGGKMIYMCSNYMPTKLLCFCGSRAIREYFNPRIFRQRRCITVKMDVERTRTMPHCSIVAFASVCRPKYDRHLVVYQLIIRLSWCEASNDVDLFLLYGQAAQSAEVEMVVSSIVAEAARTEVKQTIGVKRAADGEGDLSKSKRGAY